MSELKEVLWRLGALDASTAKLTRRLAALPALIVDAEAKAVQAREVVASERGELEEHERLRRSKEAAVQDFRARRSKFQSQTALIKTNTEYTALLGEIDGMAAKIAEIEDEILVLMEKLEGAHEHLEQVEQEQHRIEQEHLARTEQLRGEKIESEREIEHQDKERERLLSTLEDEIRERYLRVRALRGTGSARIEHTSCGACHRSVPPETINRVLAGELHTCGGCQRILVLGEQ